MKGCLGRNESQCCSDTASTIITACAKRGIGLLVARDARDAARDVAGDAGDAAGDAARDTRHAGEDAWDAGDMRDAG